MAALTAVVVALSIAVAANFLLLLAVVRKLRLQRPAPPSVVDLPRVGMKAPAFAVRDSDGRSIDDGFYPKPGEAVVAFLSDDCPPCERVKAELARDPIAGPFLAFVQTASGGSQQTEFAAALARTGARTVLLKQGSDIPGRFSVSAFPTLLKLRDGIVVASSVSLADVRVPVANQDTTHRRLRLPTSNRSAATDRLVKP
jgi:hypothetical protein